MQRYSTITVLRLPDCNINAFGVMQIAEMLRNIGCVRDLNLDMNPNVQENYHLLCTSRGRLCKITDTGVEKIARELQYRDPPNNPKLLILNLANNHVTKDGAVHLGQMLRTNRSLRCLVLLGNRICDEGASSILQELKRITLSHEEIVELRRRKFAELALLDEWVIRYLPKIVHSTP
ncbi:PREDICTED: leucine-rich repeat-containing protein 71-like [Eufriesea mexicana]|uniref:leucine-rich repeat-containing protein 71-like n=1 Tax=Eufriesea mexicana TaxID=516756 RepID=UPI00083BB9E8|nr:PREDICTED: leucine-rich repeat-containing protein 71-like [Eufriesea mexicana]